MKHSIHLIITLLFAGSVFLSMALENAHPVDAKGLPGILLFTSPPGDSPIEESEPSPADIGEFEPGQGMEGRPIRDPEMPGLSVIFPIGAIQEAVKIRFFSLLLPPDVPPVPNPTNIPDSIV